MAANVMRILRETNGYTQEYVGSILGIEQNTYSKLEAGRIRLSVDRVKKLSTLYNVEPEIFLSKDPVIHCNRGEGSHSNSGVIENYNDGTGIGEVYEKVIAEKERNILFLQAEVKQLRKEREQLLRIIKKLSK